jgi:hypothetical protein
MIQISKNITLDIPVLLNLDEMNEMLIDFMKNEGEYLIYAFTDRKENKCNQYFFTTHKLIISDRVPNVPYKMGKYHLTGWGGDLVIPYNFINEIVTRQFKTLFTRRKMDLSVVFKDYETFLSSKDADNFTTLLDSIKNHILTI